MPKFRTRATAETLWELVWQHGVTGETDSARVRTADPASSLAVLKRQGHKLINLRRVEN